jgi:DnaJ-class molecular chaperone
LAFQLKAEAGDDPMTADDSKGNSNQTGFKSPQNSDVVPPNTPDSAENVCRRCAGTGRADGGTCPDCNGTGIVITPVGGAG